MQLAGDVKLGGAAARVSFPYAIAHLFGARLPAPPSEDVLSQTAQVERLDAGGDYRGARDAQAALVARLEREGANREVLADALWRLGRLDAEVGYREPARRRPEWRAALDDYNRALELVPLSVTILLAAGNQALLNGDRAAAADYFRRALANDPSSEAARDGLHRALTGDGVPPPFVAPAEWDARKR
ncbi:MAG: hypothetical protein JO359_08625 [Candidatus Eremiobacteraeota bacterium]|nr:hypothetical protein [Candidatus Eremiobacteraeota bacterium]